MRVVIVTGTRENTRIGDAAKYLDELNPKPHLVLVGDATGIDREARAWCRSHDVALLESHAIGGWPAAGPRRNRVMAVVGAALAAAGHDVHCVAFPDAESVGTHQCVRECKRCKIHVEEK